MPTITNPSLYLTFLEGDLEAGHLGIQTIEHEHIIRHAITFHYQLLADLKSSSNQVRLLLDKDCTSIEDIIATEGDIKAVLLDGSKVLFTGYLSTNFSWTVTHSGKRALEITLEDIGTRLLGKAFIDRGHHLFHCSASTAIASICTAAGISVSESCTPLPDMVTKTVDSTTSCKELLDQLVYELGYVYHFDALGELRLFKIDCASTADVPILDKRDLYVVGGNAITLSKKIRQYKSARVSFTRLGTASNYLIYRNTTGRGDGHPYCYMKLEPGMHFDGGDIYTPREWEDSQADTFRDPALIEACNAESEILIVGSNQIIAVSNVRKEFVAQSGSVSGSITAAGGPYLKIEAHNSGSLPYYITRMDAYADIIYARDTTIVRTADEVCEGESSDNLLTEELTFVHSRELAQHHANLLGQYHRYCNTHYVFYAKQDIASGSIIKLIDNAFSGLTVNVLITGKSYTDESEVIQYQAVGISAFDLGAPAYSQTIDRGKNDTAGGAGPRGEDAYQVQVISEQGTTFRMGLPFSTTMRVHIWQGGLEITDLFTDADFRWYRESGDVHADDIWNSAHYSIGGKVLTLTQDDVAGRSTFFCDLLTKRR